MEWTLSTYCTVPQCVLLWLIFTSCQALGTNAFLETLPPLVASGCQSQHDADIGQPQEAS